MIGKKLLKLTKRNKSLYKFVVFLTNKFNPKNKLKMPKGCFEAGATLINRLTIKNKGTENIIEIGDFGDLYNCSIYISGKNNKIKIADSVKLKNCSVFIHGSNNSIVINQHAALNSVEFYIEDDCNEINIGKHTNFFGKAHLAAIEGTKISIGEHCLMSGDLHFRTGDSHSILDGEGKRINPSLDITIGNHVWFGTKVTCLKNVVVSENSVVAATTTLCRQYTEPNCIIAGVPGKVIKNDINWDIKRIKG